MSGQLALEKGQQRAHPRSPAHFREHRQLAIIHDSAEPKVRNHDVRIRSLCAEDEVLGLQIYMESIDASDSLRKRLKSEDAPRWTMPQSWI